MANLSLIFKEQTDSGICELDELHLIVWTQDFCGTLTYVGKTWLLRRRRRLWASFLVLIVDYQLERTEF